MEEKNRLDFLLQFVHISGLCRNVSGIINSYAFFLQMTNVKPKHIFIFFIVSVIGILAFGCITISMLLRPLGDKGAVYETYETANNTFKVRMTALYEEKAFMPGSFLIYESAPIDSDKWHKFLVHHSHDAVSIRRETFRFLNEQTAYVYLAYDFAVTLDGGQTWKIWKPLFPDSNGELSYWAITEARVEADGTGQAKVVTYDEPKKARVTIEICTEDFGQNWRVKP